MSDAVSFTVTTYRKLAKGETGATHIGSVRMDAASALQWILNEFPEDAYNIAYADEKPDGTSDVVQITIDWRQVPESIRFPTLPARRR